MQPEPAKDFQGLHGDKDTMLLGSPTCTNAGCRTIEESLPTVLRQDLTAAGFTRTIPSFKARGSSRKVENFSSMPCCYTRDAGHKALKAQGPQGPQGKLADVPTMRLSSPRHIPTAGQEAVWKFRFRSPSFPCKATSAG